MKRTLVLIGALLLIATGCTNAVPKFLNLESSVQLDELSAMIKQSANQNDPTNNNSIQFEILFSEEIDVSTFTNSLFMSDPGPLYNCTDWTIINQGDNKSFTVQCAAITEGLINPSFDITKISNLKGEKFIKLTLDDNNVTYDSIVPSLTISLADGQSSSTSSLPASYKFSFSEKISAASFTTSDLSNSGTSSSLTWNITDTGDGQNFIVSATSATEGTIIPNLAIGSVSDLASNVLSSAYAGPTITYSVGVPSIINVTSSDNNGTYTQGMNLNIQVRFNKIVHVTGLPKLQLETGSVDQFADYSSGSGTDTLTFEYTVLSTDINPDLDYKSTSSLDLNGGTIKDTAAVSAVLTLPTPSTTGSLSFNKNLKVIGTPALLIASPSTIPFGDVSFSTDSTSETITITNSASSSSPATLTSALFSNAQFNYVGGSFPGSGGTCSVGGTLNPNASCTIVIKFNPNALGATNADLIITYNNGDSSANSAISLSGNGVVKVETVYPTSNWNDYIQNDGANRFSAAGIACTGSESGDYFSSCIHSAEIRKVYVPGRSCAEVTIEDDLNVFDWQCSTTPGGINFHSIGLKQNKGLKDLINSGSWRTNFVTITNVTGGGMYSRSIPKAWWSNPLTQLTTETNTTTNLSSAGTIYYTNSSVNIKGLHITADKVALVTTGVSKINYSYVTLTNTCNLSTAINSTNDITAMICANSKKFLWIEADINADSGVGTATVGINLNTVKFSRLKSISIEKLQTNVGKPALLLKNSTSNYVSDLKLFENSMGVQLLGSAKNIFNDIKVAKTISASAKTFQFGLDFLSYQNKLLNSKFSYLDSGYGGDPSSSIIIDGSNNLISNVVISNIKSGTTEGGIGILLNDAANNNVISRATVFATGDTGLKIFKADSNIVRYLTTANNKYNGVFIDSAAGNEVQKNLIFSAAITNTSSNFEVESTNVPTTTVGFENVFMNIASTDSHTYDVKFGANVIGSFTGFIISNGGCLGTSSGLDSSCNGTATRIAGSAASSFVGKVSVDANEVGNAGTSAFGTITSFLRWISFSSFYRGWGVDGLTFPDITNVSFCSGSSTCRIWDWRVQNSTSLENRSFDGSVVNASFTTGGSCISGVNGGTNITHIGKTFLKHAFEIDDDLVGNNNGLCESNEDCIYAPNIGAYQGHGTIDPTQYCSTSGTVSGAKVFKYQYTHAD